MPHVIAFAAVGAGLYFGARVASRVLKSLEAGARSAAHKAEERSTGMVAGGDLKEDPKTGVFRVEQER